MPNSTYTFLQDIGQFQTAITGWIILSSLVVIAVFSLTWVRRSQWYDAFYWTHKLQFVFWIALCLHAPLFWKIFVGPAVIFLLEKSRKYVDAFRWSRASRIIAVNLLSNQVGQTLQIPKETVITYAKHTQKTRNIRETYMKHTQKTRNIRETFVKHSWNIHWNIRWNSGTKKLLQSCWPLISECNMSRLIRLRSYDLLC